MVMTGSILVLDPVAPAGKESRQLRRSLDGLAGKVVGFIDNAKPNFNHLVDDLSKLLVSRYGVRQVITRRKRAASVAAPEAVYQELAGQCDLVITGSGD